MQKASAAASGVRVRVAGFWRRTAAAAVDGLLLLPLVLLFGGATSAVAGRTLPRFGELGFGYVVHLAIDGGLAGAVALAIAALVAALYQLVFLVTSGQTPGMRILGLRVIDAWGDPPSVGRALLRIAALVVSLAAFCAGYLWVGFSREKRGLHDLLAGTWVVRQGRPVGALPATAVGSVSS